MKPVFTLIAAVTIDGKIARNSKHFTDWTSKEDKDFLHRMLDKCDAVIVGRKTYETAKGPLSKRNCVVFTRRHGSVKTERSGLVFLDPFKTDLSGFLRKKALKKICVLGGEKTYSYFLAKGLVDEIYLTIEPVVFGFGLGLFGMKVATRRFRLVSARRLNRKGALLLHYKKIS